ncbi:MAG: hypothetical protein Q9166_005990 [cf. Caloplaca sp. 2 TL-2023]
MTQEENSPLSRAIRTGDADTLRRLLDESAKPSDADISEAQNGEFPEVCKVLITAGFIDINEDFEHAGDLLINIVWELKVSSSALLFPNQARCAAAEKGHLPLATMLLEHGAHVSGTAALLGAAGRGHLEMVGDRRKKVLKGTALHKAAERGDTEIARVLLDRDTRIEVRNPFDRIPLVRAREKGRNKIVEFLKSRGAKD